MEHRGSKLGSMGCFQYQHKISDRYHAVDLNFGTLAGLGRSPLRLCIGFAPVGVANFKLAFFRPEFLDFAVTIEMLRL
jgi:hypothetical protein